MPSSRLYLPNKFKDLYLYLTMRFVANMGYQMQTVVIGWDVYAIRKNPMDLGWMGLAQFLPIILLAVWTGQVADRHDRKQIIRYVHMIWAGMMFLLYLIVASGSANLMVYLFFSVALGIMRSFSNPASQAFIPQLVEHEHLPRATAWNASVWQTSTILGPVAGGLLLGFLGKAEGVYLICALCAVTSTVLIQYVVHRPIERDTTPRSWKTLFSGVEYVFKRKKILGAISLDLFAVLFGGVTALLPAYASDILKVGPQGLGLLRSAPGVGAILMSLYLGARPLQQNAGTKLFISVALFGIATILFGISTNLYLSLVCLFILGAADIVSVVIRMTMVQLETPPNMRGRVSAVNSVFISASNELGEFESGMTAAWWGIIPAVVIGGAASIVVAVLCFQYFPELRKLDKLA